MNESVSPSLSPEASLKQSIPQRLNAAGIHFAVSAVIFVIALYLILVHWYPSFHFAVDGGWQGVRIMAAVDFILGPLLTLIIFNPFKARRLIIFDLCCIGAVQIGALTWGFYAIHMQHPVAVNFYQGTFYSVTAAPIIEEKYEVSMLEDLSDRKPALVFVSTPEGDDEEARAAMMEVFGTVAEHEDPLRYKAFAPNWEAVKTTALDPVGEAKSNEAFAAELDGFVADHGGAVADYRFFPFEGRYGRCTLAFTAAGELVDGIGCQAL